MRRKIIVIGIIILLTIVGLSGCFDQETSGIRDIILSPEVEIISENARTGYEGFDYVIYVDTTVYNRGGDGKATVWVKLTQGNSEWTKNQAIYIKGEETRDLTFTFKEASFWTLESGIYLVWVE